MRQMLDDHNGGIKNARPCTSQLNHHRWTDRPMNERTAVKASYRVACPQLKTAHKQLKKELSGNVRPTDQSTLSKTRLRGAVAVLSQ